MLTNLGLVEFVKKARDRKDGYVYGTFGQILTPSLLEYKRTQYPYQIEKYYEFIKSHYLGKIVWDCVGLIKGYIWTNQNGSIDYNASQDVSANGMFAMAKVKGPISTMPDIPGIGVRYDQHIAVYIGNGKVVEAKGTQSGVVETNLKLRPWSHWLEFPYITYIKEDKNEVMKKGEKGENVNFLQTLLNINGASLNVDSSFGGKTEAAVIDYQRKIGLPANGVVDFTTLCRLGEDAMSKCVNQYERINTKLIKIRTAYKNMENLFN